MQELTIGRSKTSRIVIDHGKKLVSRDHALLRIYPDGACSIIDKQSRNGTSVNGKMLIPDREFYLQPGDQVLLARKIKLDWEPHLQRVLNATGRPTERLRGDTAPLNNISHGRGTERMKGNRVLLPPQRQPESSQPPKPPQEDGWREKAPAPPPPGAQNTKPTVLTYTVVGDFFDKAIPIPGITRNTRAFFNLHFQPITKILKLIEQPDGKEEVNPFGFFGYSIVIYVGLIVFSSNIFEDDELIKQELLVSLHQNGLYVDFPVLMSLLSVIPFFVTIWLSYQIFNRSGKEKRSFTKFLKLASLTQGFILIYAGLWFLMLMIFIKKVDLQSGSDGATIAGILWLVFSFLLFYFSLIFLRSNRRFWGVGWGKYIGFMFLVGLASGIVRQLLVMVVNSSFVH